MELITWVISVLKTVPVWVWIVAAVCVLAPTLSYALKRSFKVVGIIALIAICLFVFPSIGTAFMETAGLTYDPNTNKLTNRAGQTITIQLPDLSGTGASQEAATDTVADLVSKAQTLLSKISSDDIASLKSGEFNTDDVKAKITELFGENISDTEAQTIMQILDFSVKGDK